jgi:hypothetical protein
VSEKHKSLSGKQRTNDGKLEIFICDDYCTHELWSIYVPSKTPDCFGDYYSLTYIQQLIKGETK